MLNFMMMTLALGLGLAGQAARSETAPAEKTLKAVDLFLGGAGSRFRPDRPKVYRGIADAVASGNVKHFTTQGIGREGELSLCVEFFGWDKVRVEKQRTDLMASVMGSGVDVKEVEACDLH